jgi:hypothetical protein
MEPFLWKFASDFPLSYLNLHAKVSLFLFLDFKVKAKPVLIKINLVFFPAALDGYEATLFDCQDNKQFFCSRNMCEKHQFIVKC